MSCTVRGWDGGENSIDMSSAGMEGGDRKPVRDSWDQELDRGKVCPSLSSVK